MSNAKTDWRNCQRIGVVLCHGVMRSNCFGGIRISGFNRGKRGSRRRYRPDDGPAGIRVAEAGQHICASIYVIAARRRCSDHDSVGSVQQRSSAGWGSVAELMIPTFNDGAFEGGPQGPNRGSPRGLLDVQGWQLMDKGAAAQSVQGSSLPEPYARGGRRLKQCWAVSDVQRSRFPAAPRSQAQTTLRSRLT